jgi:hypothetical protein
MKHFTEISLLHVKINLIVMQFCWKWHHRLISHENFFWAAKEEAKTATHLSLYIDLLALVPRLSFHISVQLISTQAASTSQLSLSVPRLPCRHFLQANDVEMNMNSLSKSHYPSEKLITIPSESAEHTHDLLRQLIQHCSFCRPHSDHVKRCLEQRNDALC